MTLGRHPTPEPATSAIELRVRTHVERLAGLIGPRHLGRPSAFEAAAAYVERSLGEFGDPVRRETYPIGSAAVSNFILERRGTTRPDEIVIVGAFCRNPHYHEPSDSPETLDYARLAEATIGIAAGAARLAGHRGAIGFGRGARKRFA